MGMKLKRTNRKGQAIVEYIIIVVIVAVAALTVVGLFSDRVRSLFAGAINAFGGNATVEANSSKDVLKQIGEDGSFSGN